MPKGTVPGKAKLTVDLHAAPKVIELTTTELEAPVVGRTHVSQSAR